MAHPKHAAKRKRRSKVVPVLGAAGLFSLAGGASAATVPAETMPSRDIAPSHDITLGDEELSDVSLGTFYVFDKENAATPQLGEKLAWRGCGGCGRGCGCRGCGRGCGWRGCGCWGGCGCGCCMSWGGCRYC